MLSKLIEFSLQNRFLVIILVALVAGLGIYNAPRIPIDAVPDMTNTQVQVLTEAGSLSPIEVEQYVSYPVESTMAGLPDVIEIRSISKLGLSVVTVVFEENVDLYHARNLINERLGDAKSRIGGYGDPQIGTLTTALGEILQFEVRGKGYSPMELRTILEWQAAPRLRDTPGVTEINSMGGFYKSFEVQVDPEKLTNFGITVGDVCEALRANNITAGGGYIVHYGEQRFVRGEAMLKSSEDIENVVVKTRSGGLPIVIRDIGEVVLAH